MIKVNIISVNQINNLKLQLDNLNNQFLKPDVVNVYTNTDYSCFSQSDYIFKLNMHSCADINRSFLRNMHITNIFLSKTNNKSPDDIILFLDGDILLSKYYLWYAKKFLFGNNLSKNYVLWGERIEIDYDSFRDIYTLDTYNWIPIDNFHNVSWKNFGSSSYICNTFSLYDTSFIGWGMEDIEWAYRNKDMKFIYNSTLITYHIKHEKSLNSEQYFKNICTFIDKYNTKEVFDYCLHCLRYYGLKNYEIDLICLYTKKFSLNILDYMPE